MIPTVYDIARMIDHALLAPTLTTGELDAGCRLAVDGKVASVCIMPYALKRCAEALKGTGVKASTTIGFPHGGHTTAVKVAEAEQAMVDGGDELDMVVNIGKVLSRDWDYVRDDTRAVIDAAHAGGAKVKVIFENAYLRDDHKIALCDICAELNADWVKTSTGFGPSGATVADVALMRKHCPQQVHVKAAGGIRTLDTFLAMHAAGADRIGTSRTAEILDACRNAS